VEKNIESLIAYVVKSTDERKLVEMREKAEVQLREKAAAQHVKMLADAVTERLGVLAMERGADPIEPAFDKMLEDIRKILGRPRQRTINEINGRVAAGIPRRQAIIEKLSKWALVRGSRVGFDGLKSAGRLDATGEALILKFPSYFPENIAVAARARLESAGWREP
jgi:hypothetical protein